MGRIQAYTAINCAVNPETGREADQRLLPALRSKKVMIVGGGMAGLEAARVLALRGHRPVLYEAGDKLGGVVIAGGQPSFKEDDLNLIAWYEATLAALGVEIHLGTPVTAAMIDDTDADHLIVATGSYARTLALSGGIPVIEATDALLDATPLLGRRVVIVGGGLTGCELALHLRELDPDTEVTIVELGEDILSLSGPLCHANHDMLRDLLPFHGVEVLARAAAKETTTDGLLVATGDTERLVPADVVVTAVGYRPNADLYEAVRTSPIPRHLLGDARKVSNIMYAIWDAYEVATGL